jgi:hypothetical protein
MMSLHHLDPRAATLWHEALAQLERGHSADAWATLGAYQERLERQEEQLPEPLYRACSVRANILAGMILLRQGEDHAAYAILKTALLAADRMTPED